MKKFVQNHHIRGIIIAVLGILLLAAVIFFGFVNSTPNRQLDVGAQISSEADLKGASDKLDLLDTEYESLDQKDLSELEEIISQ